MNTQSTLNPTFWSEVINYIGFSAYHAENLRPIMAGTEKAGESSVVLVFSTSLGGAEDLEQIRKPLNKLLGKDKWTVDLDDEDKVLRVVCQPERQPEIAALFSRHGFAAALMPY